MAFSRIAELVSASTSRMAGSHSPAAPSISSGVLPPVGHNHGLAFANPRQKTNLRLSSSLQDFSTYHRLDIEEDNLQLEFDQYATRSKPPLPLQRENSGLSFPKDKTFPAIPFIRKKVVRVTMVVLCLLLFFFVIFLLARHVSTYWSQKASQFYVVLDCGSTGTRVYVYESSIDHNKDASLPVVLKSLPEGPQIRSKSQSGRAYQRMETEPGFDKLVHNISGLNGAIKPLIWWAEKQIPEHAHKSTSVFLYATGGVRRLPNPDSEWLLDNAWSILKNSSFLCQREWVKIITGMEEAYYGWIALNYHSGRLGSTPAKSTFGALDMGGSSLQVTFESKDPIQDETSLNLSIGAVNHQLSAYSLSGYGLNDAFDKSVVHLLKRVPGINDGDLINGRIELKHPCLQSGYKEKYMCSQCASLKNDGGSLLVGEGKMGKGGKSGIAVKLIGAPHWKECNALAKVAVNLSEWTDSKPGIDCELQPCALTDGLPHPNGQFYAISGFFVVFRFFNLTSEATLDDVLQKGREFCEQLWDVAKNSVPPQPFIEQYCFRAPYIVSLLREGLHIVDNQVIIGSGSITWTLGVALLNAGGALSTSMEHNSYTILRMKINPITLCAALFMSLIILICALSCLGNSIPILFRRPYLPLFRHNSATVTSVLNIPSPFRLKHWSPINSEDGRVKTPMSPTVAGSRQRPFSMGGLGCSSDMELMDSSLYPSTMGVSHSYSSGSLGQMQFENNGVGSFWSPHRGQMRLQSRRSQSREDLNSSLAEAHLGKV